MPVVLIKSYSDLEHLRKRVEGKSVVLGTGCFDILHKGHLYFIEQARRQGEILVIGINSDASVRRIKGDSRPILPEQDRAELIAAMRLVDFTFIYDSTVADECIVNLKPDVFAIGEESVNSYPSEINAAESVGAKVYAVPRVPSVSTTSVVTSILQKNND